MLKQSLLIGIFCLFGAVTSLGEKIDRELPADHCELYVNGFVQATGRYIHSWIWLESYLSVNEKDLVGKQGGEILEVGMLANGKDVFKALRIEPAYYRITTDLLPLDPDGHGGYETGEPYDLKNFSYYVIVKRADGSVDRLWLSNGGKDFQWPEVYEPFEKIRVEGAPVGRGEAFALKTDVQKISPLFNQRKACQNLFKD